MKILSFFFAVMGLSHLYGDEQSPTEYIINKRAVTEAFCFFKQDADRSKSEVLNCVESSEGKPLLQFKKTDKKTSHYFEARQALNPGEKAVLDRLAHEYMEQLKTAE